jgi:hypothetical protein
VFDLKPGIIASAVAFTLSFLIGIVSGAGFLTVLIRALVFAVVFFGLVLLASYLIRTFMPDLMPGGEETDSDQGLDNDGLAMDRAGLAPGARVDVSVGDDDVDDDLAPFLDSAEQGRDNANAVGMDQQGEDGYTGKGLVGSERQSEAGSTVEAVTGDATVDVPAKPPELIGDVDALPPLDTFADSFVSPIGVEEGEGSSRPPSSSSSSAGSGAGGDFKAKEMAMAIQTILKRDQKG